MKTRRASLQGRLILWGAALTAVGIVVAGLAIAWVLERFVVGQIDGQLDARTAAIADLLTERGVEAVKARSRSTFDPPFNRPHSGWFWQVVAKDSSGLQAIAESDTGEAVPQTSLDPLNGAMPSPFAEASRPIDAATREGSRFHARFRSISLEGKTYFVIAGAPRAAVLMALWQLIWPVSLCILLLGIAMTLAIAFQVRWGLRPLRALERDIAQVRSGGIERLPSQQPQELLSLVSEMNQLIDQNDLGIDAARRRVANLAHSLKTPLASIKLELERADPRIRGSLALPVDQIENSLRYHLARARANAMSGSARERITLAAAVGGLLDALRKLFAERGLHLKMEIDEKLQVICEPHDLDEILGNVLENACKWAHEQVLIRAVGTGGRVLVSVLDDGPGVPDGQMDTIAKPGRRLDSQVAGDGFGLSIVQELIELHGGAMVLSQSSLGGFQVDLTFRGLG